MDEIILSSDEDIARADAEAKKAWLHLREINFLCDVVIQTEDGGCFRAHRAVLNMCSRYFRVLFTSEITKNARERDKIRIPGVTESIFRDILEFAYSGQAKLTAENVANLLIGADQFFFLDLLDTCCEYMRQNMGFDNCIGIWEFASAFFCFNMEKDAEGFIQCNFEEVTHSDEYLKWPIEKVVVLLNCEKLNIVKEELVWEAGLRWIEANPSDRRKFMHSIMRCVRLGLLDNQYFMATVKEHEYVKSSDMCKPIVIETLRFKWDLEQISTRTDQFISPFLATPRLPHTMLFTIGGWVENSASALMETMDCKADRWIEVNEGDPSGPRAYHKLAVAGYNIYVIGGFNGMEYYNNCRCFNAVTKEWKDISPMNSKRCYVSVAILDGRIYAMGGNDGQHRLNSAERYSIEKNQWDYISPMHAHRSDASAAVLNGLIYIVGGFNGSESVSTCECYNPATDTWIPITPMHNNRTGVSAVAYHGRLYALGGFNGISRLNSCERYDPETGVWTAVPDMYTQRSNFATEVIDDVLFAIGGFDGQTTICDVECYSDSSNEWYEATRMNFPRSGLAACVVPCLPNVEDYAHANRSALLEEKRQSLLQETAAQNNGSNDNEVVGEQQPPTAPVLAIENP